MVLQPVNISDQVAGIAQHYWEHLAKSKRDTVVFKDCSDKLIFMLSLCIFMLSQTFLMCPIENAGDMILWTLFQSSSFSKGKPLDM